MIEDDAAAKLQAVLKRRNNQPIYNDVLNHQRATKTLQAAMRTKKQNSDFSKSLERINQTKRETAAGNILQAAAKRRDVQSIYNEAAKPIIDAA